MARIVVIGSGKVAESLCRAIAVSPHELIQLCARNAVRGKTLAETFGCSLTDDPSSVAVADIYVISVKDDAIATVASRLGAADGSVVAHTAGSVPMTELPARFRRGVFYPLQSFSEGRQIDFSTVPLLLEADSPETMDTLRTLACDLSDRVSEADSAQRAEIHLAAVFASNFTNHMYAIGQGLLRESGIDPGILSPLIAETAAKAVAATDARRVQTGPAVRGDRKTMEAQCRKLASKPHLLEIYKLLSQDIWETSKKI